MKIPTFILNLKDWFVKQSLLVKILIVAAVLILGFIGVRQLGKKQTQVQYQTTTVERGTLVKSVSASGTVTAGTNLTISTQASGIIDKVMVKNGDSVVKGQPLAKITLDQDASARQTQTLSTYLSAQNSLASAKAKLNSLQAAEFKANQTFMNDAVERDLANTDPTFIQEYASWLQAEADYKNQSQVIQAAQTQVQSAYFTYQQISPTILAPASGIVRNLTLAEGAAITASTASNNSVSNQQVGTIELPSGHIQAVVNLSEIDAPNVKANQKVTMTLDAFPNKTFTGKVLIVNTNGSISSNVTTYPATIVFDTNDENIYTNMGVSAQIITIVSSDVLLVPNAAVTTSTSGTSSVQVMKNGKPVTQDVEIGDSNDTQTVITSGLNEGDTVVTGTVSTSTRFSGSTTSPFGGSGLGGTRIFSTGGGGGGAVRGVTTGR